ncbi:MAG: molybdopterin molybdenumtransferase MoeA [Proteobacteria bacterium]|nr:MAG: molybdopterin molybdenumtransferase MoeA [Pseudomonadota bacterium]
MTKQFSNHSNTDIRTAPSCADDSDPESLSLDQAKARILASVSGITQSIKRPLRDALGKILAVDIISPIDVPNHKNAAMDGYALAGEDLPTQQTREYRIIGKALAGMPFKGCCKRGECVRIMTGATLPDGCDTVVMQEHVELLPDAGVRLGRGHQLGQNVRHPGEDIRQGTTVLAAGRRLNPADLGVLASLGINEIWVKRPLRVAFCSTGDELRSLGETLGAGEVYDSNRYTLYGMLQPLGVELLDFGVVADEPALLETTLQQAAEVADVVITSGGVSVGEADYIKALLNHLGKVNFWKVAIKPGRPLAFGQLGKAQFFGLPGNPVAVMVTFLQLVQPALQKMAGETGTSHQALLIEAICLSRLKKRPGRTEFQRGIVRQEEGHWVVEKTGHQGSGILSSMSRSNGLIILPEAAETIEPGDRVQVQVLNW